MSTITVDAAVQKLLSGVTEVTEVRDVDGNLLGVFTPRAKTEEERLYEKARKLFDPVELERRMREETGHGKPLAEIIKRLEALEK